MTSKLALIKGMPVRLQTASRAARVRSVSNTTLFGTGVVNKSICRRVYAIAETGGFFCRDVPPFYPKSSLQTVCNNFALFTCRYQVTNASLQISVHL